MEGIDWRRLRKQKAYLLERLAGLGEGRVAPTEKGLLRGILNLLDALQEYAVNGLGMEPEVVYDAGSVMEEEDWVL